MWNVWNVYCGIKYYIECKKVGLLELPFDFIKFIKTYDAKTLEGIKPWRLFMYLVIITKINKAGLLDVSDYHVGRLLRVYCII